jgi:hypothetical protein
LDVKQYRNEAATLRTRAEKETNPTVKAKLLDLAAQYESLANQREDFLDLQKEIRATKADRGGQA